MHYPAPRTPAPAAPDASPASGIPRRSGRSRRRRAGSASTCILAALAAFSLLAGAACAAEWEIEPVETPEQFATPRPRPQLVESSSLIRAGEMRAAYAVDGSGLTVAVLDTGLRTTHVDFAGKVVAQRNYTSSNGGNPDNANDGNGHGTNVGGIIVANGVHTGIAPGANIIPIKVLSDTGSGTHYSVWSALTWVLNNRAAYNITAVNLSLGDGSNNRMMPGESYPIRDVVRQLRAARVAVVITAGNSFYYYGSVQGMGYPGIIPECVGVGAVYDANIGPVWYESGAIATTTGPDRITPFSQRLTEALGGVFRTDIFAPGAALTSSGNSTDIGESVMHGTSQAAPVVAGAILLLQQNCLRRTGSLPTVDQLEEWLRGTAATINDGDDENDNVTNTGADFPRIDLLGAAALADAPDLVIDSVTPTKSTLAIDERFDVTVVVRNTGITAAGAFEVGLHGNRATAPTTATTPDFANNVAGLAAGTSMTVTFAGVYYPTGGRKKLWVLADQGATVNEATELNNYGPTNGQAVTVFPVPTLLALDSAAGQYSDYTVLRATLTDGTAGVAGKDVAFTVDGTTVGISTTDAGGVASFCYRLASPQGTHALHATFVGDPDYVAATGTEQTLTVTREDVTLAYSGDPMVPADGVLNLGATVTQDPDGSDGDVANAGQVRFVLKRAGDGVEVATVDAAVDDTGTATATTTAAPFASYTVGLSLLPNDYFTAQPVTGWPIVAPVTLTVSDVAGQYSDGVGPMASLTDSNGGLGGKPISFLVDGAPFGTAPTCADGTVGYWYTITVGEGTHTVQASFAGDAEYAAATSAVQTLTVTPETATLTYTGDTTVPAYGVLHLSAAVTQEPDGSDGDIANAGQVRFVVTRVRDGYVAATVDATVDGTGVAAGTVADLPALPYLLNVTLLPNDYFTAPDLTDVPLAAPPTLTLWDAAGQYGDSVTFTATLLGEASGLAGRMVSFLVDGTTVGTATTGTDGVAIFAYTIPRGKGTSTLQASFAGDFHYAAATSADQTLTVTREDATLTYTGDTMVPGTGVLSLAATVTQADDGTAGEFSRAGSVRFVVRRTSDGAVAATVDAPVDGAGAAAGTTPALPLVSYTVDLSLLANDYFAAPEVTGVNVTGAPTLVVDAAAGQYSDTVTLRAELTAGGAGVPGKTVSFLVAGQPAGTGVTGADGVATCDHTLSRGQGTYPLQATFAGDAGYASAASTERALTVESEDAAVAYTGQTIVPAGPAGALALGALVAQADDGGPGSILLAGSVQFTIRRQSDGTVADTQTAAIQADGTAAATSVALPNRAYTVEAALMPNDYYAAPAVAGTVQGTPALVVGEKVVQFAGSAALAATLTAGGSPVAGKTVVFSVAGEDVGTGITGGDGVASFTYAPGRPVGTYTLAARFAGDAFYLAAADTDATLRVVPGPPARLAFTVQPSSALLMRSIAPSVQVVVQDQHGNTVTDAANPVTIRLGANPGHSALYGTATVAPVNGIATFASLRLSRAGKAYRLAATSPSLTGALSAPFDIVSGQPERLAFLVQPANAIVGAPISPAVQVVFLDGLGQVVTDLSTPITLTLYRNPSRARLSGGAAVVPVSGVATFANLRLDRAGAGYTLRATAARVAAAVSALFHVVPAAPAPAGR